MLSIENVNCLYIQNDCLIYEAIAVNPEDAPPIPCYHFCKVILENGYEADISPEDAVALLHNLSDEKIKSDLDHYSAKEAKKHFFEAIEKNKEKWTIEEANNRLIQLFQGKIIQSSIKRARD